MYIVSIAMFMESWNPKVPAAAAAGSSKPKSH